MADQGERTEKPTQRRLDKARKEGRFVVSRELVAAVQFAVFVAILQYRGTTILEQISTTTRGLLHLAFTSQITVQSLLFAVRGYTAGLAMPFAGLLVLPTLMLATQLATTKLGIATKGLTLDFSRLNPLARAKQIPSQNLPAFGQALVMLPVFTVIIYLIVSESLPLYMQLPLMAPRHAVQTAFGSLGTLLWRSVAVLLVFGFVDLFRQKKKHDSALKMSKQEIREEMKESDGNPQLKARIRQIQRDTARRNMMKAVPLATAVIVNPTHFSVAIRYEMETMAAPLVVAKGKNYLALRIRQIAMDHQVPIVENQPLAQALYKSADVGQEIPMHLYKAVAEVLAYIFRLMNRRR